MGAFSIRSEIAGDNVVGAPAAVGDVALAGDVGVAERRALRGQPQAQKDASAVHGVA